MMSYGDHSERAWHLDDEAPSRSMAPTTQTLRPGAFESYTVPFASAWRNRGALKTLPGSPLSPHHGQRWLPAATAANEEPVTRTTPEDLHRRANTRRACLTHILAISRLLPGR
jgi:hypothetical protein